MIQFMQLTHGTESWHWLMVYIDGTDTLPHLSY